MLSVVIAFTVAIASAGPEAGGYPRPELLVEPAELGKIGAGRPVRILDARGLPAYRKGHIPGAVRVDPTTWARAFKDGQDREAWSKRIGGLGVDEKTLVVVYDDQKTKDSARIWWILRYWGIEDVRLLNGGWKGWQASGGKVSKDEAAVKPVSLKLKPVKDRLAGKGDILEGLEAGSLQIVDARSADEHCGKAETAKKNGAIPGALHLEWSDALDAETHRFKPAPALKKLFDAAGIDPKKPTATHCQSGGRAAVMAFTLELMGGEQVKNYYRSWAEWGNADDTPVVRPEPKK